MRSSGLPEATSFHGFHNHRTHPLQKLRDVGIQARARRQLSRSVRAPCQKSTAACQMRPKSQKVKTPHSAQEYSRVLRQGVSRARGGVARTEHQPSSAKTKTADPTPANSCHGTASAPATKRGERTVRG